MPKLSNLTVIDEMMTREMDVRLAPMSNIVGTDWYGKKGYGTVTICH